MTWVAVGVGGAALVGGVAGSMISSSAAGSAADKQAAAANQASQLQYSEFQQQQANQAPWQAAGARALGQLQDPSFQKTFDGTNFQQDPAYQFDLAEGQKAIERSAAARGGLQTGGTLKAITNYAQGMASNEYQNAYNRFTNDQTNRFNRLSSIAGLGQTANAQMGQTGMNTTNQIGSNLMGGANAQAGAQVAQGQMWGNTLSSVGTQGGNAYMGGQILSRLPQYGTTGGSPYGTVNPNSWAGSDVNMSPLYG